MKTTLRATALLASALLLASCSSQAPASDAAVETRAPATAEVAETAPVEPLAFNAGGLLGTNAAPTFEAGDPDKIAVVHVGALEKPGLGAILSFAFRNNTAAAISHVDWSATARSGGAIVATGSSQGTAPAVVQPGEVGLAYIYFDNGESIPDGTEYEFSANASPADTSFFNTAPMTVTESNLVSDAIVGAAVNQTGESTEGPYSVMVFCFDGDTIVGQIGGFTEQNTLAAGATGTFTVSLYGDSCANYAVGVSGYYS